MGWLLGLLVLLRGQLAVAGGKGKGGKGYEESPWQQGYRSYDSSRDWGYRGSGPGRLERIEHMLEKVADKQKKNDKKKKKSARDSSSSTSSSSSSSDCSRRDDKKKKSQKPL